LDARYVGFCDTETAERLTKTVTGTVLPFALDPAVDLVADPVVLTQPRLYVNAARLGRSIGVATSDYARLARPRIHPIAAVMTMERSRVAVESSDRFGERLAAHAEGHARPDSRAFQIRFLNTCV
jgi:hypothetical protein